MNLLPRAIITMSSQRDRFIFSTLIQTAVDDSQWVEHSPVSTITSSSPIEFIVSVSGKDYMDLNNTILEDKACIQLQTTLRWMQPLQLHQ